MCYRPKRGRRTDPSGGSSRPHTSRLSRKGRPSSSIVSTSHTPDSSSCRGRLLLLMPLPLLLLLGGAPPPLLLALPGGVTPLLLGAASGGEPSSLPTACCP